LHTPAITFLDICSNEFKTYVNTWMSIVVLYIFAKTLQQLCCASIGECINISLYINITEYYSTTKINEPSDPDMGGNLRAYCYVQKANVSKLLCKSYILHDST
jgi:hypothetical protein